MTNEHEDPMQAARHYTRAPIIEAIIDLRVTLPEGTDLQTLAQFQSHIADGFPAMEPLITGSLTLQAGQSFQIGASQQQNGFQFRSTDGTRVFQATLAGFTYNRLPPYDTWEVFRDEAKSLWSIYQEVCRPSSVTRAAMRYINRLELPGPSLDFKDYLRTGPEIAPQLPQGLSSFFMQLQIPQEDLNCMLIVNEALAPTMVPGVVPVILDIDLFREQVWQSDDEEIWRFLENLRDRKNLVFEASLTDKAKELFQ